MKLIRFVPILALLAILAACFGSASANREELKSVSDEDLCERYYFSKKPYLVRDQKSWPTQSTDIKQEIDHRHLVDANDWAFIDSGRLQPGMTECGLRAAWGYPMRVDHVTTLVGNTTHFVYSEVQQADIVNGKITKYRMQ